MADFHGMNDQAGEAAVDGFESARTALQAAGDDLRAAFTAVQWEGPDAEAFTPRFLQTLDSQLGDLLSELQAKGQEFADDVQEQTSTSGS